MFLAHWGPLKLQVRKIGSECCESVCRQICPSQMWHGTVPVASQFRFSVSLLWLRRRKDKQEDIWTCFIELQNHPRDTNIVPSLSFPWHWFPWPSKNWCRYRSNAFQFIHPKLTQWYKIGEDGRPAASLNLHVHYLLCWCIWFSKRPAVHLLTALVPHSRITT